MEGSWGHLGPKMASKSGHEGLLEGSWGHVGPKMAPRAQQDHQKVPTGPPVDLQAGGQNGAKIDKKCIENLIDFLIDF